MLSPGKDALGQATYERHRPEQTLLYQLIDKHCPALVGELEEWPKRRPYWLMRSFPMCHCDSGSSVFHSLCDSFSPPTLIRPLDRPDSGLERVAKANGFSLHAGVSCEGHQRGKRERLCRYMARPAVATPRLSLSSTGTVVYTLKTPYSDGTTQVAFDPVDFIARLAALARARSGPNPGSI